MPFLLVKVCLKRNIMKVFIKRRKEEMMPDQRQRCFLSNIKMSSQHRIVSRPSHCQIKNLQIQKKV